MLATLSTGPAAFVPSLRLVPGSPGVLPAWAQPKLTSSCEVMFWVTASQPPLRCRSLKFGFGALRYIHSPMRLTVVLVGSLYCTPAFKAYSSPILTAPTGTQLG